MQANRQHTSWNPQIALAVVAVGILAAVWLNMAKLKMGMGQPQHDISQVPIAQNITSDEIEELRNGKPLELILADRPDYDQIAAKSAATLSKPPARAQRFTDLEAQTSTALPGSSTKATEPSAVEFSGEPFRPEPPRSETSASPPTPQELEQKNGFRPPLRDSDVAPVAFASSQSDRNKSAPAAAAPAADSSHSQRLSTENLEVSPQAVPRANPSSPLGGGGGSFLEKFPGQSQQLPNLKHGPAQNAPAQPLLNDTAGTPPSSLPTAAELSPLPFGDLSPGAPNPTAAESAVETSAELPAAHFPAELPGRPGTVSRPSQFTNQPKHTKPTVRSAGRPQPAADSDFPVILTKEGETWWTLAQRVYDDGRLFRELYEFNRDHFPDYDSLPAGRKVTCPPRELLLQPATATAREGLPQQQGPARGYRTRAGETVFEIAREHLGQASRFAELLQLNRDRLPAGSGHLTPLPAGTELILPQR